jgi:mono/diheme cytochrome c family protein
VRRSTRRACSDSVLAPFAALTALFVAGCSGSDKTVDLGLPVVATGTLGDAVAGEAVYLRICFACHQLTGLGLPYAFPPLVDSPIVTDADPGKLIRIVVHGLQGPIEIQGITYNSVMPPPAPSLTDKEVADVLTYVRNAWGNEAAPVTAEAVTAIRTKVQRSAPWTWAELEKQ